MIKRVVLLCLVLAACKSGQGDRCQVTDDCSSDLLCSASTGTCQPPGGVNPIDASVVIDAPPPDAPL